MRTDVSSGWFRLALVLGPVVLHVSGDGQAPIPLADVGPSCRCNSWSAVGQIDTTAPVHRV